MGKSSFVGYIKEQQSAQKPQIKYQYANEL